MVEAAAAADADEVCVWRIRSDGYERWTELHGHLLDPADRRRAETLRDGNVRRTFLVGHLALRLAIAAWLCCDAGDVEIARRRCHRCGRAHGKPWVRGVGAPHISFSRSGPWAVVALGSRPLGVDVEARTAITAGLLELSCAPAERASIEALPSAQRSAAFTRLWCRKEAVSKVSGAGLDLDPRGIDLGLGGRVRWGDTLVCDVTPPDDATACAVASSGTEVLGIRAGRMWLDDEVRIDIDPRPHPLP